MRRMTRWTSLVPALLAVGLFAAGVEAQRQERHRPQAPARTPRLAVPAPAPPSLPLDAALPGARSPRNANYVIKVALDPATNRLNGSETLTWRNITRNPTAELRFHLYYNAWKNTRSTWLREAASGGRVIPGGANDWGWIDVTAIRLVSASAAPPIDLTSGRHYIAPDDGNADDETVLAVPLPSPVASGEAINVEIEWTSKIPRTFARTGALDHYFFIAQWFPKLGVLEDNGWNCHQFHAGTEFFSDYGSYDVTLNVPSGWVVGATGVENAAGRSDDRGSTSHRFVEQDVHDFAWTTSPSYVEKHAQFSEPGLPPVDMRLLLQPEHAALADRHFAATRVALKYYGQWFGPYPYSHITIVDPAWQSGTGGMEYPTLFTAGSRWLAPADVASPEGVTIHECGHQFWYAIVGNNEFEHAWLDEGFNTYSTSRAEWAGRVADHYSRRYFGGFIPYVFRDIPLSRLDHDGWSGYRGDAKTDVPANFSYLYPPGSGGALSYSKTALWLSTLERYLGWTTMQKIMSTYFDRWKFRHPKPQDFFDVVNEVTGRDLTWFFDQVYRSSNVFDYGVEQLTTVRPSDRGVFGKDGGQPSRQNVQSLYRTVVVVRRYGEALFPVDVEVTFADGSKHRAAWDGRARWKQFTLDTPTPAVSAVVDPDRVLLLDVNRTNNSRTLAPQTDAASTKWMFAWMAWFEDQLLSYAYFV